VSVRKHQRRRAVLYGRVSNLGHGETSGRSVDSQLAAGQAWADRENIDVVGVYRDDGISAYNQRAQRPAWKQVMAELAVGNADILWCWEVSRASRDREVWAKLIRTCQANDIWLTVGDRTHDPNDPDDGFMLDLTAALAVRESAMTRKRILRAVKDRATAGRPHGKIPYGYRREYDPTSGALLRQIVDDTTAPVIREMARRVLAGESMYAITNDLNGRGVPSPETVRQRRLHGPDTPLIPWHPSEVKDQLVSPTNAGQRTHNGIVVADATWPAIIPMADHVALVAKLTEPGRKSWRDGGTKHLLTGIAECGVCGARMRRVSNRGYPSYACAGKDKRGASCVSRLQAPVDELVTETVLAFLEQPEVVARLLADVGDEDAAAAAAEVAELRARLDSFIASAAAGGISPATLAEVEGRLRPQIADAKRRAVPTSVPPLVADLLGPHARRVWEELGVPQRRQVVRFLMRVIVHRSGRAHGGRGFDPSRVEIVWLIGG
jgi:site-specific DNA recombinase